jgi:hypothetical protein
MVVLGEEEQGTQAELLNVEPDKYMLNCFGEKESPGVAGIWLVVDPNEQVLVQEIEEKEGRKCEAVDDGRYDGITERDDDQLSHCREESTPLRCAGLVLDPKHGAWGRTKEGDLDIIHN